MARKLVGSTFASEAITGGAAATETKYVVLSESELTTKRSTPIADVLSWFGTKSASLLPRAVTFVPLTDLRSAVTCHSIS